MYPSPPPRTSPLLSQQVIPQDRGCVFVSHPASRRVFGTLCPSIIFFASVFEEVPRTWPLLFCFVAKKGRGSVEAANPRLLFIDTCPKAQNVLDPTQLFVRFGDVLSSSKCHELIRKLAACAYPFCCAHGRPSVVPLCVVGGAVPSPKAARGSLGKLGGGRWAAVGRKSRQTTG